MNRTMEYRLTDHEVAEFQRAATALYKRGANAPAHLLSVVAAKLVATDLATRQQFTAAADAYRAWLVFDDPKGGA